MECEFCFGKVKKVDEWEGYITVECTSCMARYDVLKVEIEKGK